MNDSRIERLTREALGPARRTYTKVDDALLRAIGIVILVVTVVAFASWPRDDANATGARHATKSSASTASAFPVSHHKAPSTVVRIADHTPIY